jgi:hypothetical protein
LDAARALWYGPIMLSRLAVVLLVLLAGCAHSGTVRKLGLCMIDDEGTHCATYAISCAYQVEDHALGVVCIAPQPPTEPPKRVGPRSAVDNSPSH